MIILYLSMVWWSSSYVWYNFIQPISSLMDDCLTYPLCDDYPTYSWGDDFPTYTRYDVYPIPFDGAMITLLSIMLFLSYLSMVWWLSYLSVWLVLKNINTAINIVFFPLSLPPTHPYLFPQADLPLAPVLWSGGRRPGFWWGEGVGEVLSTALQYY